MESGECMIREDDRETGHMIQKWNEEDREFIKKRKYLLNSDSKAMSKKV